ncbi:isovaleryl-CoA dehydrogenase [Alkanindiges sp. WGS2144]|uniref:isovaleryl-CoA dehydrogenase n=1 Tax=Alkanindiges sp. WGS2144 TaxID=3366808 RepID=UPI0037524970
MNQLSPVSTTPQASEQAETHPVFNVATALGNINLFTTDTALQEAIQREGAGWAVDDLEQFGALTGTSDYLHLGHLANKFKPELDTHDRFGNRVDVVHYHPAYHQLMSSAFANQLHSSPWVNPGLGAHVARAAKLLMQGQVEAGHICPTTMTFASIPSIRTTPKLAQLWEEKILSSTYDPRNIPATHKNGLTVGMGMTEKQGGSDVRANTTVAVPVAARGAGEAYEITGHKWFLSAPMCDLFLVLANTEAGISCFLVPRWRPDGSKNSLQVIRLKNKMGNVSNASSEVEFRGALGWLLNEEGRGVATIIEMVSLTRFDCMIGSTALMRRGLIEAIHHCQQRAAFGKKLIDQPLMQNLLADLTLEYESALALTMRMARALDHKESDIHEALLARIATAIGKYWICKRTPNHIYEAMEIIGGSGVMEDGSMPRLYREAVINTIWEGSGNVQCLDVLRAMQKTPETIATYFKEVSLACGKHVLFDKAVQQLQAEFKHTDQLEFRARSIVDQLAAVLQAALLLQHAPEFVSHAFCASRLGQHGMHNYGSLPVGVDAKAIIARTYQAN